MKDRIFGIETEYGCLPPETDPHLSPDFISLKTKDGLFFRDGLGLVDMHYRGRDEPPGNGGFLFNGGRLYIDMGHVEYATPECQGLLIWWLQTGRVRLWCSAPWITWTRAVNPPS